MFDAMQRYFRAGLDALSSQRLPDASNLVPRLDTVTEQLSSVTSALNDWWQEAGGTIVREVKDSVVRQVESFGFATKKDVETLRARLDRLEARGTTPTRSSTTSPARSSTTGRQRSATAARPAAKPGATTAPSPGSTRRGRETPGRG